MNMTGTTYRPDIPQLDRPRHLGWQVILVYWFAQYAAWLALVTPVVITMALRMRDIAGEQGKAEWLGLVLGVGAMAAMIAAPIWGAMSDRTTARVGRRKPWIIGGAASLLIGLTIMALANDPLVFGLGWLVCQIGSNAAQAAFNALMSDIVPENQRGLVSALLAASATAAIVTGVAITQYTTASSLAMFLVPWIPTPFAVGLFLWIVPDSPAEPMARQPITIRTLVGALGLGTLRHRDFAWAFSSRFLVLLSAAFAMTYQVYYLTDYLHVPHTQVAEFMVLSTSLMGALTFLVSCCGGWLSDKAGRRKPFVASAAVLLAAGLGGMSLAASFEQFLLAAALTGVGQGLYYAVDIALCVEVLPHRSNAARDMAVLQIANSLPQSLAPTIAPILLGVALGGLAGRNYPALFLFAALVALAGAAVLIPIKKVR